MTAQQPRASSGTVWRRRLLAVGALVAVAVAAWLLFRSGGAVGPVDKRRAQLERITIDSKAVGQRLPVSVVVPNGTPGGHRQPLLVFLHGRGEDENTFLDSEMFKALADLGREAPIIAFPYGGDHSYWHDRADGSWGTYVTDEVIHEVAPARYDRTPSESRSPVVG